MPPRRINAWMCGISNTRSRRLINDYVVSPKNAYKLNRWLEWAELFRARNRGRCGRHQRARTFKLFEVENIVKCATFPPKLLWSGRKAGGAMRTCGRTIQRQDDQNWLCHVDVRRGKDRRSHRLPSAPWSAIFPAGGVL